MTTTATKRSVGYWIVAVFALVWNLIGVAMWYLQVSMTPEQLAAMPGGNVDLDALPWERAA